ncbi:MAG TPA: ABC transporter permease [Candidatus Omnitrophota bacterium]|nr:ABC transporter permease [Candidatus Omnitrophota bacterium]
MAVLYSRDRTSSEQGRILDSFFRSTRVLFYLVRIEIRQKYAGSLLGMSWLFLYPLVFLTFYAGVYLVVFKVRIPELSNWGYVLTVFCGLVPYLGFSDALQQGVQSLSSNVNLLKNTVFPPLLIPVKTVFVSQVAHSAALTVLLAMTLASGKLHGALWLLPVIFILQTALIQGVVWIVSFLSIVLKDIQYVLNLALFFLLFISPVAFTPGMAPHFLQKMLHFNPLHYTITLYRYCFLGANQFPAFELTVMAVICPVVFGLGYFFFKKNHKLLLEYV